ncbi:response regulator [soil metagenome]
MQFRKVLLIDDDELDLYVSKRVLKSSSFAEVIITTNTVNDAMHYLINNNITGSLPDFIFLDLNMPGQNGLEFLKEYEVFARKHQTSCIVALLMNVVETQNPDTLHAKSHPLVKYVFEKPLTEKKLKSISVTER